MKKYYNIMAAVYFIAVIALLLSYCIWRDIDFITFAILTLGMSIYYKQCAAEELLAYQQPNVKLIVRDSPESKSLAKIEDKLRKLYDETELIEAGDILQNVIELRDYVEKRAEREAWEEALDYSAIEPAKKPEPQRNLQGEPIAKGVRELPSTKGTFQSICEIEDLARSYLHKEYTTGIALVLTRLNNLRRTLEMQIKMNEQNTPKKIK